MYMLNYGLVKGRKKTDEHARFGIICVRVLVYMCPPYSAVSPKSYIEKVNKKLSI